VKKERKAVKQEQGWNQKIEALYREHRDCLYRAAYRILGRRNEAEDAVHTAFVRLLRMREHYDALTPDELYYMVICVVRHAALNMLRDERKRQSCALREEITVTPERRAYDTGMSEPIHRPEQGDDAQKEKVRETLSRLPEEMCRLLWMKYYAEMSGQDIATALHISRHAVEMRLHRAKRELLKRIKEDEDHDRGK